MRTRNKKKTFWFSEEESRRLEDNAYKCGMNQSNYLRSIIMGYIPKEKPPKELFEFIEELRHIGINYNQIAKHSNELGYISNEEYQLCKSIMNDLIKDIKVKYLYPNKVDNGNN